MNNKQTIITQSKPRFKEDEETKILSVSETDVVEILKTFGTDDVPLMNLFLNQAVNTNSTTSQNADKCNLVIAALAGIKPKDELESMLAVQMLGVHNLAMKFLANATIEGQSFEGVDANTTRATKLLRTFTAQIEALNSYRGKGKQKITVEHVQVNEGGQAIVGNIEGGGVKYGNGQ